MLIVATARGVIYFFKFTIKNHQWVDFRLVGYIELNEEIGDKSFHKNPDAEKNINTKLIRLKNKW